MRQLANENETGYSWVDGLLVHEIEGDAGEIYRRLVVPRVRRADILKMAHNHLMAGHLAYKKMTSHLKRLYTWPGIGENVLAWCKSCARCQKTKSGGGGTVPLHLLPVINEPNHDSS